MNPSMAIHRPFNVRFAQHKSLVLNIRCTPSLLDTQLLCFDNTISEYIHAHSCTHTARVPGSFLAPLLRCLPVRFSHAVLAGRRHDSRDADVALLLGHRQLFILQQTHVTFMIQQWAVGYKTCVRPEIPCMYTSCVRSYRLLRRTMLASSSLLLRSVASILRR